MAITEVGGEGAWEEAQSGELVKLCTLRKTTPHPSPGLICLLVLIKLSLCHRRIFYDLSEPPEWQTSSFSALSPGPRTVPGIEQVFLNIC